MWGYSGPDLQESIELGILLSLLLTFSFFAIQLIFAKFAQKPLKKEQIKKTFILMGTLSAVVILTSATLKGGFYGLTIWATLIASSLVIGIGGSILKIEKILLIGILSLIIPFYIIVQMYM